MTASSIDYQTKVDPLLLEVADVVNTTLDLDTSLRRVAELVRKVIDYEIFAILLLNEKTPGALLPVFSWVSAGICRENRELKWARESQELPRETPRGGPGRRCCAG